MRKMLFVALTSLPLLLTHSICAQSAEDVGLKIDGAFISGERRDYKDYVEWSARVTLTIRNDGNKPLILINGCFDDAESAICSKSITFVAEKQKFSHLDTGEITMFKNSNPENLYPLFWRNLIRDFDHPTPSSDLTTIIEPGGMREFSTGFVIKQKIQTKLDGNKKVMLWENSGHADSDQVNQGIPLSDASYFVISFNFVPMEPVNCVEGNFKPGEPVPNRTPYSDRDFLKRLSYRWRETGILPLNSSGTYSITSQRIVNGEYEIK